MKHRERADLPYVAELDLLKEFQMALFPTGDFAFNEHQHVGCGYDATIGITDVWTVRVEGKHDLKSRWTSNVYLETSQSFNGKDWQESGLVLCMRQKVDIFVVAAYHGTQSWFIWGSPAEWRDACRNRPLVDTLPNANGNHPGAYAKGYLVAVADLLT